MIETGKQIIEKIGEWSITKTILTQKNVGIFLAERDIGSRKEMSIFKMFKREGSVDRSQEVLSKLEEMITDKGYRSILSIKEGFVVNIEDNSYICVRMEYADPMTSIEHDEQLVDIGLAMCKAINEWDYTRNFELQVTPEDIYKDQRGNYKIDAIDEALLDYIEYGKKRTAGSYSSPEVYKEQMHEESARVYSLGIALYEIANNGVLPFLNKNKADCSSDELDRAMNKCLLGETMDMPCNVSDSLGQVILNACAYNISDRYSTVIEFADALQKNNQGKKATSNAAEKKNANKLFAGAEDAAKKSHKKIWIIILSVFLVGAAVAGFLVWKALNVKIAVPNLKDMTYDQAKAKLTEAGLELEEYTGELGENYLVASQIPAANESVKKKTTVKVEMYEFKKDVVVPDVVGNDEGQATNVLMDVGLQYQREYTFDDAERGTVISLSPEAGQTVKEGDTINLVISQGKEQVEVPNLIGKKKKDIDKLMEGIDLEYQVKDVYDDNEKEGIVISQDVKGGTKVDKGSVLIIQVSKGPKPVEKPVTPQISLPSGGGGGGGGGGETTTEAKKKKKSNEWNVD